MPRYTRDRILTNASEYYAPLRKSRGLKAIRHYETPVLRHPSLLDRALLNTTSHIWKTGDRFYKLADKYYGDANYWWVIAWYTGYPTEATIKSGDPIQIPLNLESTLFALGM